MEFDYTMGMEYYQDIFQREVKLTNEQMRQCMLGYAQMYKIRGEVSSINSLVESLQTKLEKIKEYSKHMPMCRVYWDEPHACTCGLDELLKTLEEK